MSVITENLPKLKQNLEEKTTSSRESQKVEPKSFLWDRIIFSIASTIFALSFSGIIIDFFRSDEYSLACFSPLENRAQYTYINSYCHKHLPVAEYFPFALIVHTAALIVPHYLWKALASAQFDTFFINAAKIETLSIEDTGKYPPKNHAIVNYLRKEFGGDRSVIFKMYVTKIISQLFLVVILIIINTVIFADINTNITFQCYEDDEGSQLFGNVTCAYPKKLYSNVLQVFDYLLLGVAVMVLGFALWWCLLYNHPLADHKVAVFCYLSSLDAKYYKPSKKLLGWCQMKSDLEFLLASLSATNSGLSGVFKTTFIENITSQYFFNQMNKGLDCKFGSCICCV